MPSSHPCFDSPSDHTRSPWLFQGSNVLLHDSSSHFIPPPSHNPTPESSPTSVIAIDLNLRFCSDDGEFQCNSHNGIHSDGNGVQQTGLDAAKASVPVGRSDDEVHNEKTKIEAEIREEEEKDKREDNEGRFQNESNRLGLLTEAAGLVSGKQESEIEEVKESWMVVKLYGDDGTEEKSPVVRAKRGRSHALPYRFRDSFMKPLKRTGRPHRPSSNATASRKRLSGT